MHTNFNSRTPTNYQTNTSASGSSSAAQNPNLAQLRHFLCSHPSRSPHVIQSNINNAMNHTQNEYGNPNTTKVETEI